MADADGTEDGYFAVGDRSRSRNQSPGSIHSDSLSMHLISPSHTMASLTALQYLPIPLLVLSSQKTVVLANEAMGRLLGIDFESTAFYGLSITGSLQDRPVGDLGIDILQNGSPLLITWEVRPSAT